MLNSAAFTLHIGATELEFEDASFTSGNEFKWSNSGLSWSAGDHVTVRLTERPINTVATGRPIVIGTRRVARDLIATTEDIFDENGRTGAVFTYQWVRVDGMDEEDIPGATKRTYYPVPADEGKRLRAKVWFTDDEGFEEGPIESIRTDAITRAEAITTNCPGTSEWDSTLTIGKRDTKIFGYFHGLGVGALSDRVVDSIGADAQVTQIADDQTGVGIVSFLIVDSANDVRFGADYNLCIGPAEFNFADADRARTGNNTVYSWRNVAPGWRDGAKFDVGLFAVDQTAPTLESVDVPPSGRVFVLDFDESMNGVDLPQLTSVEITVNGAPIGSPGSLTIPPTNPSTYVATLPDDQRVHAGDVVVVRYTDPSSGDDTKALQDPTGNDVASFTTGQAGAPPVTNGSTVVTSGTLELSVDGHSIVEGSDEQPGDSEFQWKLTATTTAPWPPSEGLGIHHEGGNHPGYRARNPRLFVSPERQRHVRSQRDLETHRDRRRHLPLHHH